MDQPAAQNDSWNLRRIAILGAGAMGTSLAAMIGRSIPTVVICRDPRRAAELFEHGARLTGLIESHSRPIIVRSISDLAGIGGASVLFIATKTTAIPSIARELRPLIPSISDSRDGLFIVSYQNGIESGRQMLELLGYPRILRMVLTFGAVIRPGSHAVECTLNMPPHDLGCVDPAFEPACRQIVSLLTRSGFDTRFTDQIESQVWRKGIVNAAANPVCALVNAGLREVLASPARVIVESLLREGLEVARAEHIELGENFFNRAVSLMTAAGDHTPSMVEDIRLGRESEVGQLNRQIIQHGRRLNIPTPTHDIIDALIETFDWRVYQRASQ